MAIVRADTFTRANASGSWGTASDGNTWAGLSGNAGDGALAIASNEGTLSGSSTASSWLQLGSALSSVDAEGLVRFAVSTPTGTTSDTAGIFLRASSNTNYMLGRYTNGNLQLLSKLAGTTVTNSTAAFTPTAGTFYWLKVRFQGSSVYLRCWADGSGEPGTWNIGPITDTNFSSAGESGLFGFGATLTKFDHFSVDDLSSPADPFPLVYPVPMLQGGNAGYRM